MAHGYQKAALIAGVAAVFSFPIPLWNGAQSMFAIESIRQWTIPLLVLTGCFAAIMPAFYFALYRYRGTLHISKRLRWLSLMAAIAYGIVAAGQIVKWSGTTTITRVANLLVVVSNLAIILLLITLFRHVSQESDEDIRESRHFGLITKATVIVWGIIVPVCVVRLLFIPSVHLELRDRAIEIGRTPPRFGTLMADAVRTLVIQACLFVAPYVVFRSPRRRSNVAERAISPA